SYIELNERANQLARHLQKLHVHPKEFVGVFLERSDDLIVAVLGILKLGAVYVPIDPSYPLDRKLYMIEHTAIKVLVTESAFETQFSSKKLNLFCIDKEYLKDYDKSNLKVKIDPLSLAYINYTSGSTGTPKGIEYPHLGLVRLLKNPTWMKIGQNDRMLQIANVSFDMFAAEVFGALLNGATLCIYPQGEFSSLELGRFILENKVSHLYLIARLFTLMVEEGVNFLSNVRFFGSTGDVMSVAHANIAYDTLKSCQIVNLYGPTENHITTAHTVKEKDVNRVSIGRPVQGTQVYILNSRLKPVPLGVHGEICIGGEGLAKGYLKDPKRTKENFVENPFAEGALYRTGDLGRYLPDKTLEFLGRLDTQVKLRGFRIELDEVEVMLRKHPQVADCIAIVKKDELHTKNLVVYIEPKAGNEVAGKDLREYLSTTLPKHAVPRYFVILPKFPLTPNGKVDRKNLPSPTTNLEERAFDPPRTKTEKKLAKLWSYFLKITNIGRQDDFFHIGGHSILAMQLSSSIRKEFHIEISVSTIFEYSTLEKYAEKLDQVRQFGKIDNSKKEPFSNWRNRETTLDASINIDGVLPLTKDQYTDPKKIFLTGATGFVGAFFLRELLEKTNAKIYCLVRAKSDPEAEERLIEVLKTYLIWKAQYKNRIIACAGSLDKPLFGFDSKFFHSLASEIDSIFHFGAFVNHAMSYQQHKPANVFGTQEILRLASTKRLKIVHFISTVAVLKGIKTKPILEDDNIEKSLEISNGYVESKWISEKLILIARERGIPCNIFRLPRVSGDTKIGSGPTGDFLWRFIQASIKLKMTPQVDLTDDLTPVDYVCSSIHSISTKSKWINSQFHVMSPYRLSYSTVFEYLQNLGYQLPLTDFITWRNALVDQSMSSGDVRLQALASLLAEVDYSKPLEELIFDYSHLQESLKGSH
ncbi:MAG: amino acid adenylation domain-containing protein, partial [Simkaniaceae bacterium]|nr:amino acid adenylation domain-containing protein [Simkaniaceae bacterium]